MKYFLIGERELVIAFALAGVEGAVAVNRGEALEAFNRVTGHASVSAGDSVAAIPADERPKVLIITEDVAVGLEDEILQWQLEGCYPLIVEIPGIHGHLVGKKTLTDSIREAVGIHV